MTETVEEVAIWKQKYAKLADELDDSNAWWKNNEKQLCRAIIRLTLATSGLDPSIDPHLQNIRELLKRGIVDQQLHDKLNEMIETLIRSGSEDIGVQSVCIKDLFDLLTFCVDDRRILETLDELHDRVIRDEKFSSSQLLSSIRTIIGVAEHDQSQGTGADPVEKTAGAAPEAENLTAETELVRWAMLDFLSELEVPSEFDQSFAALRQAIGKQTTAEDFKAVVAEIVDLLGEARKSVVERQEQLENFLNQLTQDLGRLGSKTLAAGSMDRDRRADHQSHQASMVSHFKNLRETSQKATDLIQLQDLIRTQLEVITDKIEAHNRIELSKQTEADKKMAELTRCVEKMELETSDLRSKLRMARNKALRDQLTGLPNRLAYEERLEQEVPRRRRFKSSLSLLIWDVDRFKTINDRFGHAAGDKVLKTMGKSLSSGIRETDFVCRYGGEEFVMLLPGAGDRAALMVADNIRKKIANCKFKSNDQVIPITISCGISEFVDGDDPETVFERADKALYEAKNQGRNQCKIQ